MKEGATILRASLVRRYECAHRYGVSYLAFADNGAPFCSASAWRTSRP